MARKTDPARVGGKLGPRLARLMGDASAATVAKSTPHRVRGMLDFQDKFFRLMSGEADAAIGGMLRSLAADPDVAPETRQLVSSIMSHPGQLNTLVKLIATAATLYGTFTQIGQNQNLPWAYKAIASSPNLALPANVAAELSARRLLDHTQAREEAARNGINGDRFRLMEDAAFRSGDVGQAQQLLNRGLIQPDHARKMLRDAGLREEDILPILALRHTMLSPAEAADMTIRGIISQTEGRAIAALAGMSAEDFDKLALDTGEPPGTQDLLFAYRRGQIDRSRLEHGIRQGRLRNEWIDVIEKLRFLPMSSADAIEAAVQGHIPKDVAKKITEENGLEPDHFEPRYQTAGEPLSRTEMEELVNRGEASIEDLKQALRESRLKNKYIDKAVLLRRRIPPERSIVSGLAKGVFTEAQAIERLRAIGFSLEDAHAFAAEAKATKHERHRDLAESQVVALYEERAITSAEAHAHLSTLGYDDAAVGLILRLADTKRAVKLRDQALGVIRSLYVRYKLTEQEMLTRIDALHVPSDQRDMLVSIWKLERDASRRSLTEAQVIRGLKKQLIDDATALQLLLGMGYDQIDAEFLIAIS